MATSAEQVFYAACTTAEGIRQNSKAAALATYGFVAANLTAYNTAISDADVAYQTAVTAAMDTSNLTLGNLGQSGPLPWAQWANLLKG